MQEIIKKQNKNKSTRGFTLLETLIAITILLLSVVGPMTIASKGLLAATYARDEISAFYLGQEAVEYIRNARETNYLVDCYGADTTLCADKTAWLEGLTECISVDGCYIDVKQPFRQDSGNTFNADAIVPCPEEGCPVLRFGDGVYDYDPGSDSSKYTRKISITSISSNEVKVEIAVSWYAGSLISSVKTFTIRENLFNWQR